MPSPPRVAAEEEEAEEAKEKGAVRGPGREDESVCEDDKATAKDEEKAEDRDILGSGEEEDAKKGTRADEGVEADTTKAPEASEPGAEAEGKEEEESRTSLLSATCFHSSFSCVSLATSCRSDTTSFC